MTCVIAQVETLGLEPMRGGRSPLQIRDGRRLRFVLPKVASDECPSLTRANGRLVQMHDLWSRFQDHIEWCFRGTAEPRKSALRENVSQAPLAGLRSKGKADFLTERTRSAYHRR
jgi:hypothetical protein